MTEEPDEFEKDDKLKRTLRLILTPEAYSRLMNVKIANPELFQQAVNTVINIYSRYGKTIDEAQLLKILKQLKGDEGGGEIIIKRK